jgi:hypothetical protein
MVSFMMGSVGRAFEGRRCRVKGWMEIYARLPVK